MTNHTEWRYYLARIVSQYWKPSFKPLSQDDRLERSSIKENALKVLKEQANNAPLPSFIQWDDFGKNTDREQTANPQLNQPASITAAKKTLPFLGPVLGPLLLFLTAYFVPKDSDFYQYQLE